MVNLDTDFYAKQAQYMCFSYEKFFGRPLLDSCTASTIHDLHQAPMAIFSHGVEDDPIFNFASQVALDLFEYSLEEFVDIPSRKSAEMLARDERQLLLKAVTQNNFIANYRGVRISATGRRFYIENAIVWNLFDAKGEYKGQAAAFKEWTFL